MNAASIGANLLLTVAFVSHAQPSCPTTFTTMSKLKAFFRTDIRIMSDSQLQSNSGPQNTGTLAKQKLSDDVLVEIAMTVNTEAPGLILNLILTVGLTLFMKLMCILYILTKKLT
jgi:hypothetical protein